MSARRKLVLAGGLLAILFIVVAAGAIALHTPMSMSKAFISVNGRRYSLDVAHTSAQQQKGLGGRASMAVDRGMLFPYSQPGSRCFWMKDMHFSLDIIWLDSQKKIVRFEQNLSPQTYPQDYCADNTQYVIELNAGQAAATHLRVGQKLDF